MSIDDTKHELRTQFKTVRKELGAEARAEADALITAGVLGLAEYRAAELILAYLDFGAEIRTRDIIIQAWAAGKLVALPWCVPGTHTMRWFEIESFEGLVTSPLGVQEPNPAVSHEVEAQEVACLGRKALCLVPGLTFDEKGYRMGYGGGFYDTFLRDFSGISIGLCREAQMSLDLNERGVLDTHDLAVELVVTDERIIRV